MTPSPTAEQDIGIEGLRAKAMAATNANWRPGHLCSDDHSCDCRYIFADNDSMGAIASVHVDDGKNDCPPIEEAKGNQAFIAAANPYVVLQLIDLIASLRRDLDEAREALTQIEQWAEAYPLTVFPEPDFVKVRELLEAGGITLDSVSASNMRHVLKGVAGIVGPVLRSLPGQRERKS